MKTLFGLAALLALGSPSVLANSYTHPCEVIYYEINKGTENTSNFSMEDFLICKEEFGTTRLITKAERYKGSVADRVDEVEKRILESQAVARGERSGKIVQSYDYDQLMNHRKNILKAPLTSSIWFADKDKTYETSADKVCEFLGFEKSVTSSQSARISSGDRDALRDAPDRIFEMRPARGFSGPKNNVYDLNKVRPSHNVRMIFQYYTSVTCERQILQGEIPQDFELDIEAIRAQVERDVNAPKLDEEVKDILSIGRERSRTIDNSVGEDYDDEDISWSPSIRKDDFFIVVPK
jgi:hypothetical protein